MLDQLRGFLPAIVLLATSGIVGCAEGVSGDLTSYGTELSTSGTTTSGPDGQKPSEGSGPDQSALKALIMGQPLPPLPKEKAVGETAQYFDTENQSGTLMQCVYKRYEGVQLYESLVSFDPNADALWPGSIVQTQTLSHGLLAPIALPRRPASITLSNALLGPNTPTGSFSRELASPNLATSQDAISSILAQNNVHFATKTNFRSEEVHSLSEAALKAGIAVEWMSGEVKAKFEGSWTSDHSTFMVSFTQNYYTVSVAPPSSPELFFGPNVTAEDAMPYMGENNPPGYIASVTYGRMLLVKIESDHSADELKAALDATYDAVTVEGTVNIEAKNKEILSNATVSVFALGGSAEDAGAIMTDTEHRAERIAAFLQNGASFSATQPGVPISYTVRLLANNEIIKVASTLDYEIPYCSTQMDQVQISLKSIQVYNDGDDWPSGAGEITVRAYVKSSLTQPGPGGCNSSDASGCGDLILDAYYSADTNATLGITESASQVLLLPRRDGESFQVTFMGWEDDISSPLHTYNVHQFLLNSEKEGSWTNFGMNHLAGSVENLSLGFNYELKLLTPPPFVAPEATH